MGRAGLIDERRAARPPRGGELRTRKSATGPARDRAERVRDPRPAGRRQVRHYRMNDLASDIYLSQSALSRAVARMERDGLVKRSMCADDRRGVFVCLTAKGSQVYDRAAPTHRAVLSEAWGTDSLVTFFCPLRAPGIATTRSMGHGVGSAPVLTDDVKPLIVARRTAQAKAPRSRLVRLRAPRRPRATRRQCRLADVGVPDRALGIQADPVRMVAGNLRPDPAAGEGHRRRRCRTP